MSKHVAWRQESSVCDSCVPVWPLQSEWHAPSSVPSLPSHAVPTSNLWNLVYVDDETNSEERFPSTSVIPENAPSVSLPSPCTRIPKDERLCIPHAPRRHAFLRMRCICCGEYWKSIALPAIWQYRYGSLFLVSFIVSSRIYLHYRWKLFLNWKSSGKYFFFLFMPRKRFWHLTLINSPN